MFVCPADDDVVGSFLAVRAKEEERGICLFGNFLELFSRLEGMDVVFAGEKG